MAYVNYSFAQSWQVLGPGPLHNGQPENIPNSPVIGAIHGIAPHPTNANILYVASVNGGVWKTTNALSANPVWTPLTDNMPSLAIGDIEFDIMDATHQTLLAGIGKYSSLGGVGGSRAGLYRTTDGGTSWTQLNGGMVGRNITSVAARAHVMLAAVDLADSFTCANIGLFRTITTGASWSQVTSSSGMVIGRVSALEADPVNTSTFYLGVYDEGKACQPTSPLSSGIYKSTNNGFSWTKVTDAAMDTVIGTNNCHFEIAVGNNNNVFVSMVCTNGDLDAVFYSANGGNTWTAMDIPTTTENSGVQGIHPGGQGFLHSSLTADPNNPTIVYIGGDRQPDAYTLAGTGSQFPNSIGANNYSGRLFRGDASLALGSQWTPITHSGTASNSAPHADSRELIFDANGSLLESDDGGIYRNNIPQNATGDWMSVIGNLQITEQHDAAYDSNAKITVSGNQDNGSIRQNLFASQTWNLILGGDGGDVAVDNLSLSASNQAVRFFSTQNFGRFRRLIYNQNNNFIAQTSPALTVLNGGAALNPQFVTPIAINNVNGNHLIIGAGNSVYESLDQGTTITELGPGIVVRGRGLGNIAYGATGAGNEDVLYIGACQGACGNSSDGVDGVFVRTSSAPTLTLVYPPAGNAYIQGVTNNPNNAAEAFLVSGNQVLRTQNTGATWTNVTGNLSGFGIIHSIKFMPNVTENALAVGTDTGVFIAHANSGYASWTLTATGIPNAPVYDLDYDENGDRLVAGTFGRGSYALTGAVSGNSPPVAGADSISVAKGATVTTLVGGFTSLLNNDTDPDPGDVLSVEIIPTTVPMNGILTLAADGTFSYQHDGSFTQNDQFFYRVCDNATPKFCADGQVDISIDLGSAVCSTPNINIPDGNASGVTNSITLTNAGFISDINVFLEINHPFVGDLVVKLKHASTNTEVVLIDRPGYTNSGFGCSRDNISATLDDAAATAVENECNLPIAIEGTFSPNNSLSNFNNEIASGNWSLTAIDVLSPLSGALISWCIDPTTTNNATPVLAAIGNKTTDELALLSFTATATDADTSQANLVFSLSGAPTGAVITTSGQFSWTPTESQGPGSYTFDVIVSDDSSPALTDSENITVTVSEVNQNPILATISNQTIAELSNLSFTALATDADFPAQSLIFSLSGAPTGASITTAGLFNWTPTESQGPGSYTFDVVVADNGSPMLTDNQAITISVSEVNQNPVLVSIGNKTIAELSTLSFTASATDADLPAQSLTFSLSGAPTGATISTAGAFSWTPSEAQGSGSYTFDVIVSDNGAPSLTDSETITVMVSEVNQSPILASIGNQSIAELSTLSFTALATDADLPAQNLTFTLLGAPTGATISTVGAFSWTPSEVQGPGSYTFDVIVSDNSAPSLTDSETITVTVSEVNHNPVLANISNQSVDELSTLSFTATATDSDIPVQNLSFFLINAPAGASITNAGVFSFTPTESQGPSSYTFDIAVVDNGAGLLGDSQSITVSVTEVNQSPILSVIGNQSVDELSTLSFTASATDTDLPVQSLTFSLSGAPTGATISTTGVFSWTPSEAQGPGSYTFDVIVSDNGAPSLTDSETITVTVSEINQSPILASIGNQSIAELNTLSFTALATDADLPAQNLIFSLLGEPTGASISSTGQFSFTPTLAQSPGIYTFDVIVSDDGVLPLTDSQTITVTVLVELIYENGFE